MISRIPPANRGLLWINFVACLIGIGLLSLYAWSIPPWSEELGWLQIGRQFANGEYWNPFRAKSDYPSSFQVIPIGILMLAGVDPIVASRSAALMYAGLGAFIVGVWADRVFGSHLPVLLVCISLSIFSHAIGFYVWTGWHEVSHVPFVCGLVLLTLNAALEQGTRKSCVYYAAAVGLGIWTLYTPFLFALVTIPSFVLAPSSRVSWRNKILALAIVCICFIPIGIMSFRTGGDTLLRHYVWVRYGGEWEHERATDLRERFNQFFESANRIGAWSLPGQDRTNFDSMIAVHPEWPLFILASIGLLYALKNRELRAQLFFPAVLTIAGLTATSPTAWRASIIGWLMIVFAVVGASMVLKNAPLYLRSLGSLAILVTQAFLFFAQAEQTVSTAKTHFVDGSLAKAVMYTCRAELRGRRVYLPEGQAFSLLQTLANPLDKIVFMPIKRFVPRVMDEPQVCAGTTNSKAFSVYAARHTPSHLAVRLDR